MKDLPRSSSRSMASPSADGAKRSTTTTSIIRQEEAWMKARISRRKLYEKNGNTVYPYVGKGGGYR